MKIARFRELTSIRQGKASNVVAEASLQTRHVWIHVAAMVEETVKTQEIQTSEGVLKPWKTITNEPVIMLEAHQLQKFIDNVNAISLCYTPEYRRQLFPINISVLALVEALPLRMHSTSAGVRKFYRYFLFQTHLALQVAFIAGGCTPSQYSKFKTALWLTSS